MKFLLISDLHGNTEVLSKLKHEFDSADLVLFAGDFAKVFFPKTSKPALEALCDMHDNILAVTGNCDKPEFVTILENKGVNCERSLVFQDGLFFIGSGGGTKFTGKTPNEREEDDILSDFDILKENEKDGIDKNLNNLIIISHNPPKNTKCDAVNPMLHAGSQKFRDFIEERQPLAVITGHIHEGVSVDKIGNCTIVNPGSIGENGCYAVMETELKDGIWSVKSVELKKL